MLEQANAIQSNERLAGIVDGMVAAGRMKKRDAKRHIRRLEREAFGRGRRRDRRPATATSLSAMGIQVVKVKRG